MQSKQYQDCYDYNSQGEDDHTQGKQTITYKDEWQEDDGVGYLDHFVTGQGEKNTVAATLVVKVES